MHIYCVQLSTNGRLRYDLMIAENIAKAITIAHEEYLTAFSDLATLTDKDYDRPDVRIALLRMTASLAGYLNAYGYIDPRSLDAYDEAYRLACDVGRACSVHIADTDYRNDVCKRAAAYIERLATKHGINVL